MGGREKTVYFGLSAYLRSRGRGARGPLGDFRIKVVFRIGCPVQSSSHLVSKWV
jgi:hypothetical protein